MGINCQRRLLYTFSINAADDTNLGSGSISILRSISTGSPKPTVFCSDPCRMEHQILVPTGPYGDSMARTCPTVKMDAGSSPAPHTYYTRRTQMQNDDTKMARGIGGGSSLDVALGAARRIVRANGAGGIGSGNAIGARLGTAFGMQRQP